MGENEFEGKWNNPNGDKPLDFFEETSGSAEIEIYSWAADEKNDSYVQAEYGTMAIRLLDPYYHNKKVIYIILKLRGFNIENTTNSWAGDQIVNVFTFDDHTKISNFTLPVKFFVINLQHISISSKTLNFNIEMGPLRHYE